MDTIADIVFACSILHNMILNDERDVPRLENVFGATTIDNVTLHRGLSFKQLTTCTKEIENEDIH